MPDDNKINSAWNKFFSLRSPRFIVQPFYDCFKAGYEAALQEEWNVVKPNEVQKLQSMNTELLRQRNYYASILNVNKDQIDRFDKAIRDIK